MEKSKPVGKNLKLSLCAQPTQKSRVGKSIVSSNSDGPPSCKIPVLIDNQRSEKSYVSRKRQLRSVLNYEQTAQTTSSNKLKMATFNVRSICNKPFDIFDLVLENNYDIFALTETWLHSEGDDMIIADMKPPGFNFLHVPRQTRGGGVGILYKSFLNVTLVQSNFCHFKSFEVLETFCQLYNLRIIIIYRPPPSQANNMSTADFLLEFGDYLQTINASSGKLIITGDFNLHLDNSSDGHVKSFNSLLSSTNIIQSVQDPTHQAGHVIDLVLSRSYENLIEDVSVSDVQLSDHFIVQFYIIVQSTSRSDSKTIFQRNFKNLDIDQFKSDLTQDLLPLFESNYQCASDPVCVFNNILCNLLDRKIPTRSRKIKTKHVSCPWFNSEIKQSIKLRRKYERQWRKHKLVVYKDQYKQQCKVVSTLISNAKKGYFRGIFDKTTDSRKMFSAVDKLLNKDDKRVFPIDVHNTELCEEFSNYFIQKVQNISASFPHVDCSFNHVSTCHNNSVHTCLYNFGTFSEEEIRHIILASPSKHCDLDPLPTWLLKMCCSELLPAISYIVNFSVNSSSVPDKLKLAYVTPVPKKVCVSPTDFKSFRPISNLPFLSKVLERAILSRLNIYLHENNLMDENQSAYRTGYSVETALCRVQNDILCALDKNRIVLLVLLDLSAAFDTVNHHILCRILHDEFGIHGSALKWFESYLYKRVQCVKINQSISSPKNLSTGVPQGSVLGPVLFTMYTASLGKLIKSHGINYHFYADDTQLYIDCDINDLDYAYQKLQLCISDVCAWMIDHHLKLNEEKTEFVVFSTKRKSIIPYKPIAIGKSSIYPSESARNLGVYFDKFMNFDHHLNKVCRSANYQLRKISLMRKYLNKKSAETLIHAFISSKLDSCNSLLFGLPKGNLYRLQRIQNSAAKIISGAGKRDHITPILRELHWLPISSRIQFKILLLTFRAINNGSPSYISDLVEPYVPNRQLRSTNCNLLVCPMVLRKSYGERSFAYAAPFLWNNLPLSIKQSNSITIFKKRLKTYLFMQHFDCVM